MTITTGRGLAVTGPKLIYTEDGKHCYAYSGQVSMASSGAIIMLNFNSGPHVIIGKLQSGHDTTQMSGAQTLSTEVKFNGVIVYDHLTLYSSADTQTADLGSPIELLIPPHTTVLVTGFTSDTGPIPTTYHLIGTVYAE